MTIYRIVFRTLWGKNYQKAQKPLLDFTLGILEELFKMLMMGGT